MMPANSELVGLTFITRPKLNLTTSSLNQDRILSSINTLNPTSLSFAIRCLLDTKLSKRGDISDKVYNCPFFDPRSPFLTPISNAIIGQSGWPDPVLDVETSEGGFHGENITIARGSDRLAGTYDITLTIRDIQGGFNMALLYTWLRFMELVTKGNVLAYSEDIDLRRLCYTCSIYRFVVDPSRKYIVKWAKATGCFPKSVPLGANFNQNEGEYHVSSANAYSIPFTVNKVDYMDPIIFNEFNRLMRRFYPPIATNNMVTLTNEPKYNYIGLPYIDTFTGTNELMFRAHDYEFADPLETTVKELEAKLKSRFSTEDNLNRPTPADNAVNV